MATEEIRFSAEHCWARLEDEGHAAIGLSEYAPAFQNRLVHIELPGVGEEICRDEEFGEVETTRGVFDIVAPVSGEVVDVNDDVNETPVIVTDDPMGDGWLLYIRLSDPEEWNELLRYEEYKEMQEANARKDEYEEFDEDDFLEDD